MHTELERYLNDHLAGSSGALLMIGYLVDTLEDPQAIDFFQGLKTDVEEDRHLLEHLLTSGGMEPSSLLKVAGKLTARLGFLKLMWEGFEPGELGLFEALEMLALGVQGKRLLWVALREIAPAYPAWKDVNFADLELEAIRQRDGVEAWRIEVVRDVFGTVL
jgi:hypothetical protein